MPDTLEPPVATGFRPGGTLLSATISNSIVGHEDGRDHNATMTAPDGSALFVACRARVEVLLDGRAGMDVVGRTIEAFPLACEEQCVLWLWAWPRLASHSGDASDGVIANPARCQAVLDRINALGTLR